MDLNFLEEFFSGYGKWKISFQQIETQLSMNLNLHFGEDFWKKVNS